MPERQTGVFQNVGKADKRQEQTGHLQQGSVPPPLMGNTICFMDAKIRLPNAMKEDNMKGGQDPGNAPGMGMQGSPRKVQPQRKQTGLLLYVHGKAQKSSPVQRGKASVIFAGLAWMPATITGQPRTDMHAGCPFFH